MIRTAKPEDAASACDVLRRSIAECCTEDHRNDAAVLAAWLGNKTPETVGSWFVSPSNFALVAVMNNEIVGVAMLTKAGKVVLCYVKPEARFMGIGKALLQGLESQAKQWNLSSLQLASTVTAKSFYLRNGYILGSATKSVCGIDALAFSKRLCASYRQKVGCGCSQ